MYHQRTPIVTFADEWFTMNLLGSWFQGSCRLAATL